MDEANKKYDQAFEDTFGVEAKDLKDSFSKDTVDSWDSIHQLGLVTALEDLFDIMLDPEDIMAFSSYGQGKKILQKYAIKL